MTEMMSSKMGGVRLRAARSGADAHFIAEQMTLSALEFAEPGVPFGLASQVSDPETQRRWRESCVAKVAGSLAPGAAASTRLWIAEDPRDGSIVGSIGIHPDLGADKGSSYVAEAVRARLPVGVEPPGDLQLGELVSFYVAKAGRGRGVGGLLMETALAFARQAGYVALSLYVFRALSAAVQVYLRHGFFIAAQYHAPGHWDEDNVMVKVLVEDDSDGCCHAPPLPKL